VLCYLFEKACHEGDFVKDTGFVVGEVAFLNGAVCFDPFQSVLCSSQLSETALGSEQLLEGSMISFNTIV